MGIEVRVPRLGWSMEEGTFLGWIRQEGELVRKGDSLFILESEKAAQEIESFDEGILRLLPDGPRQGDRVKVGQVLAYLLAEGEVLDPQSSSSKVESLAGMPVKTTGSLIAPPGTAAPLGTTVGQEAGSHSSGIASAARVGHAVHASPRARRRARELGVDWRQLTGSGRSGRIRERDVLVGAGHGSARRLPHSPTRRAIARRMIESQQLTAPVTLTTTVDATAWVSFRQDCLRSNPSSTVHIVPSYTDLIVRQTARVLEAHPMLNARWENDATVLYSEIHMGIAVDTEAGLLVPVVRNVEKLTLNDLALRSKELIEKARRGRLTPDEMGGGTFTVTNLGLYRIDAFTPIINWPECAVLGVGRIHKQPAVVDDQIVPRDLMTLSLTFDHRVVDGGPAARFLHALCEGIEDPVKGGAA